MRLLLLRLRSPRWLRLVVTSNIEEVVCLPYSNSFPLLELSNKFPDYHFEIVVFYDLGDFIDPAVLLSWL